METMKASRRKQTKPNRNPFGMDPQSGSFNPNLPASRSPLPAEEELRPDTGSYEGSMEIPRDIGASEEESEISRDRGDYEREMDLSRDRDFEREMDMTRGRDYEREMDEPRRGDHEEEFGVMARDRDYEREMEVARDNGSMEREREMEDGDAPLDMSIVSCRLCPESFATSTELHTHMDMVHASLPKRPRLDFDFPTAYHRLGSELLQENSLLPSEQSTEHEQQEQALSLTMPKPDSEPRDLDLAREQSSEGRSVKVNGGRIFHMDAYCELCDREFCNKYFLKTHKAIKHGISDDSSPSTPSAFEAFPKPGINFSPMPPKVELSPSPWQQQQELKKDMKTDNRQPSPTSRKSEQDRATEEKVSSVISAVKNSLQNSQSDGKSSSGGGSGGTTKDPSMEDYCEFCQKHFCNKYYLKKHKQDVHGIIPETGPTTTKRSRASSSLLDLPMPSTSMGSPMLLPQPMGSLGGMPSLPPGVMVLNPFMPQMLIPTGNMPPPLLHAHQLHHPPHSPVLSQSLPLPGAVPGLSPTAPTSQMSDVSPNPDTYCSMCSKEFSNVYFLKIHKANRHGIHSDEIPPEAKMLGDMVESNGVLIHHRPPSMEGRQEMGSRSSPPPLTSINQMVTCRLCDKDFPNAQAFKIHQVNEHGKNLEPALPDSCESSLPKPEPPVSSSEPLRRMSADLLPANGGSSNGLAATMFGSMVAARNADRVTCDICNKELCNKYFLKSHKLKMHGIDVDREEGREPGKDSFVSHDRYSPTDPNKAQPLNMTMSPKQPPPPLIMPKLEMRDFPISNKEFKLEKPPNFKNFHDVPTFLSETINNEYMRRSTPQPPFKGFDYGMQGFPPAPTGNMNHDQLLGEGIDPEAYCDICKKEFCSKYFLRTHKENIHGIKAEVTPPNRSRSKPGPKPTVPKISSMITGSSSNPMVSLPMPTMPFPFPPALMMRGNNGGGGGGGFNRSRDSFEKHHFRWKDPPTTNATARVTCDICNKEVCNKYFLRTHKLKKHGIAPTDSTQSPMSDSPVTSENDASSNTSRDPDNFLVDKGTGMLPRLEGMSVPQSIPLPPSDRTSKASESVKVSKSEEEKVPFPSKHPNDINNPINNRLDTVTCHLCERKFRNMQWLSAHLLKDHGEVSTPELMDLRMLPPPLGHMPHFGAELEPKMCRVCRLLLPNEISLQLHLLQEHHAQIRLQMDETPDGPGHYLDSTGFTRSGRRKSVKTWRSQARKHADRKLKMFVCSFGDYRTHWLYKLQLHEEIAHGISMNNNKKTSQESTSALENPARDREECGDMKQFKCGLCTSRFKSHAYCQMHLREAHIHMLKDFVARKRQRAMMNKLSCRYCTFTTSFPFRLHSHITRYHHRPSPPLPQSKTFPDLTPVAGSETPPESLHSSPDHTSMEDSSFDKPPMTTAQDLRKRPFVMEEEEEGEKGPGVGLSDSFIPASPVDSHVHQSLSFRVADFSP